MELIIEKQKPLNFFHDWCICELEIIKADSAIDRILNFKGVTKLLNEALIHKGEFFPIFPMHLKWSITMPI